MRPLEASFKSLGIFLSFHKQFDWLRNSDIFVAFRIGSGFDDIVVNACPRDLSEELEINFLYSQVPNKRVYSFIQNKKLGLLF